MLKELWGKDCVKENFQDRIKTILSAVPNKERIIVINCCTKPIKKSVSDQLKELKELGFVKNIYEAPHPSSWKKEINITTITLREKDERQI